jgi:hypothetical protein
MTSNGGGGGGKKCDFRTKNLPSATRGMQGLSTLHSLIPCTVASAWKPGSKAEDDEAEDSKGSAHEPACFCSSSKTATS